MKTKLLTAGLMVLATATTATAGALIMQTFPGGPWPDPAKYRWHSEWGVDHSQDPADPLGGVNGNGNGVIDEDWEDRAPNPRA